jgi:hypothetical protein
MKNGLLHYFISKKGQPLMILDKSSLFKDKLKLLELPRFRSNLFDGNENS